MGDDCPPKTGRLLTGLCAVAWLRLDRLQDISTPKDDAANALCNGDPRPRGESAQIIQQQAMLAVLAEMGTVQESDLTACSNHLYSGRELSRDGREQFHMENAG